MIRHLLIVLAACGTPISHGTTVARISSSPLEVTWSMKIDGDRLRVDYVVHNRTDEPIVLLDQLQDNAARTSFAIVRQHGPATVGFTLAYVAPEPGVRVWRERRPMERTLAPHTTVAGSTFARWPLRAHHNFSPPASQLSLAPEAAFLEVGYVDATSVLETETVGTEAVAVPDWRAIHFQKTIRSNLQRIPSP